MPGFKDLPNMYEVLRTVCIIMNTLVLRTSKLLVSGPLSAVIIIATLTITVQVLGQFACTVRSPPTESVLASHALRTRGNPLDSQLKLAAGLRFSARGALGENYTVHSAPYSSYVLFRTYEVLRTSTLYSSEHGVNRPYEVLLRKKGVSYEK